MFELTMSDLYFFCELLLQYFGALTEFDIFIETSFHNC